MESHFSKLNELVASAPLPPKLRAVADYVINNLDTCRFLTAIELAEAINVSYSTVIRLAKKLGFSGYPDFQKFLREAFEDNLQSISDSIVVPSQRIDEIIARGATAPVNDIVAAHVFSNIQSTLANNPEKPVTQKKFSQYLFKNAEWYGIRFSKRIEGGYRGYRGVYVRPDYARE